NQCIDDSRQVSLLLGNRQRNIFPLTFWTGCIPQPSLEQPLANHEQGWGHRRAAPEVLAHQLQPRMDLVQLAQGGVHLGLWPFCEVAAISILDVPGRPGKGDSECAGAAGRGKRVLAAPEILQELTLAAPVATHPASGTGEGSAGFARRQLAG